MGLWVGFLFVLVLGLFLHLFNVILFPSLFHGFFTVFLRTDSFPMLPPSALVWQK